MAVWSEIRYSLTTRDLRFEAEYYQPKYLDLERRLQRLDCLTIADISSFVRSGPFGSNMLKTTYVPDGTLVVRPFNIKNATVEDANLVYIPTADCQAQGLHLYAPGDLVFARVGDIACGVVPDYGRSITISPNIIVARIRRDRVNPVYVAVFMNTRLGRLQMERATKVVAQPTIAVDGIKSVLIPLIDAGDQAEVAEMVQSAWERERAARHLYDQAEALLTRELRLDTIDLSHQLTYERSFNEVREAGRFDADYFHPEKRHILDQLEAMPGKAVSHYFDEVMELVNPSAENADEQVYCYDLTDALRYFLAEDAETLNVADLGSTKKRFRAGDVVVSRLRSYLREIAVVEVRPESNCVGSTEFIVLRPKNDAVSPEFLMTYLRSAPVQKVLRWCQDGSNHPRFKQKEILDLPLPDHILSLTGKVTELVRSGIAAHRESARLLDEAKHRVEELIEAAAAD